MIRDLRVYILKYFENGKWVNFYLCFENEKVVSKFSNLNFLYRIFISVGFKLYRN